MRIVPLALTACGFQPGTEDVPRSMLGGIVPADAMPPLLERAWSARMGPPVQGLALHRETPDAPVRLVVLAADEVSTWDLDGAKLGAFDLPDDGSRVLGDPTGRVGGLAVPSMSFDRLQNPTFAVALEAAFSFRRADGRIAWELHEPPTGAGHHRIAWLERGGRPVLFLHDGTRARVFEPGGRLLEDHPLERSPAWATGDVTGDGNTDVVVVRPVRGGSELVILDATFLPGTRWLVEGAPRLLAVERIASEVRIAAVSGRTFVSWHPDGTEACRATVPGASQIAAADLDGDGTSGWVFSAEDGTLQLLSADCATRATHATGLYVREILDVPREGGDLLVVADERGLRAFRALGALATE